MMNILFYKSETINPLKGGIDRVTEVLLSMFSQNHNVFVLMAKKTYDRTAENFFYLPDTLNLCSRKNFDFAKSFIEEKEIDVIVNQDGITPWSSHFILNVNRGRAKLISVLHNNLASIYGFTVRIPSFFVSVMPSRFLGLADSFLNLFFRRKYKEYWDEFEKKTDSICLLDESLRQSTASFIGIDVDNAKMVSINNPLTLNSDFSLENADKKNSVLFVGRMSAEKNVSSLLDVWKIVEKKNNDWNLILVGEGKEMDSLKNKMLKLNLKRVSFEGKQNPEAYYKNASIFCMTSIYEGLPLVLVEAMNYGCALIAFNSFTTAKSLINNGENGFLIKPFDKEEYASRLLQLINDGDYRKKMQKKSYEHSFDFSKDSIYSLWENLFNKLVSRK